MTLFTGAPLSRFDAFALRYFRFSISNCASVRFCGDLGFLILVDRSFQ